MTRKRDYISEILGKRSRIGKKYHRTSALHDRLALLEVAFPQGSRPSDDRSKYENEIAKYLPVGVIACLEGYFRLVISELIDYGPPYSDRVGVLDDLRFDVSIVRAIHGRSVSLGEFIAHMLPLNSVEDVNRHMSALLGADFLGRVKAVDPTSLPTAYSGFQLTADPDEMLEGVKRAFELRHIYAHELALDVPLIPGDIYRAYEATRTFLFATDRLLWAQLYPDAPLTQADMNRKASEEYEVEDARLKQVCAELLPFLDDYRRTTFEAAQAAWEAFRDQHAETYAGRFREGTIWPLLLTTEAAALTVARREQLESMLESEREMTG